MNVSTVLIGALLVMLVGVLPVLLPTRRNGGSFAYAPSNGLGFLLIIVLIVFLIKTDLDPTSNRGEMHRTARRLCIASHKILRTQPLLRCLQMSIGTILIIVLLLMLVGVLPTWSHSSSWGYFPSGGLGLILVVVVVLLVAGRI